MRRREGGDKWYGGDCSVPDFDCLIDGDGDDLVEVWEVECSVDVEGMGGC